MVEAKEPGREEKKKEVCDEDKCKTGRRKNLVLSLHRTMVQNSLMSQGWHYGSKQPNVPGMALWFKSPWCFRDGTMVQKTSVSQGWHYGSW